MFKKVISILLIASGKGELHRKMNFKELILFLGGKFGGLSHLIQLAHEVKKKYYEKKDK